MLFAELVVVCIPWNRIRINLANVKSNNSEEVALVLPPGRPSNNFTWIFVKRIKSNNFFLLLSLSCRSGLPKAKQTQLLTSPFSNGIVLANCVEQINWTSFSKAYGSFRPGKLNRFRQSSSLAPKYCHGMKSMPSNDRSRTHDVGRGEIADLSDTYITW